MSYQFMWFSSTASQLQLIEQGLRLESVRAIVSDRLPLALKEMESKGLDLEDPNSWWELLFINEDAIHTPDSVCPNPDDTCWTMCL